MKEENIIDCLSNQIKERHNLIVIFGAGKYGKKAFEFGNNYVHLPVVFCDNDINKQKQTYCGCRVLEPAVAVKLYPDACYLVANQRDYISIREELINMGIRTEYIYVYWYYYYNYQMYANCTKDEMWEYNKQFYKEITGVELDKDKLVSFTDKMQYSKIYLANELKSRLTDKYRVREWVKERIGNKYLIPLLGCYKRIEDIVLDELPDSFVLKANHGCGMNYIVKNKEKIDFEIVESKFENWLMEDYSLAGFELHYHNIEPCIIAEEYIKEFEEESYDYKFFCFDGKVEVIMIVKNLQTSDAKRCFYDKNFNCIPCELGDGVLMPEQPFEKPDNLDEMIRVAEELARDIDQVRVDLYAPNGKIYFGEMTFTSWNGYVKMQPNDLNIYMGNKWNMDL